MLDINECKIYSEHNLKMPVWKDKNKSGKCTMNAGKDGVYKILTNEILFAKQSTLTIFRMANPSS